MISRQLLNQLKNENWQEIRVQLADYESFKLRFSKIPRHKEIGDYSSEAITKLFSGERIWDQAKCPDLLMFLKGVVDSLIYNDRVSYEAKHRVENDNSEEDEKASSDLNAEEQLILKEDSELLKDLKARVVNEIKDKIPSIELYLLYLEEGYKASEIATFIGIDVKDVYEIKRKVKSVFEKILNEGEENNE